MAVLKNLKLTLSTKCLIGVASLFIVGALVLVIYKRRNEALEADENVFSELAAAPKGNMQQPPVHATSSSVNSRNRKPALKTEFDTMTEGLADYPPAIEIKSGGITRPHISTTAAWSNKDTSESKGGNVVAYSGMGESSNYLLPTESSEDESGEDESGEESEGEDEDESGIPSGQGQGGSLLPGSDDLLDKVGGTIMPTVSVASGVSPDLSGRAVDFPNQRIASFWNNSGSMEGKDVEGVSTDSTDAGDQLPAYNAGAMSLSPF